jgi:hypothetical protein
MIDYPGEYFAMARDAETRMEDLGYLEQCEVVVFMVPFWLLIPHTHRADCPWYLPPPEIAEMGKRRSELMDSFDRWQQLLLHRPRRLLIGLTMLSADWHAWISTDCPEAFAHRIARIRKVITHPVLDPRWSPPSTLPLLDSVLGLYRASQARMLLHRLHRLCEEFVSEEIPQDDQAVYGLRSRLRELAANMGPENVRWFAFNIVSERHRLHVPGGNEPPKLREEPAGISIPCLYLSSLLFDLKPS